MAEMLGLEMKLNEKFIEESVHDIVKAAIAQALGDPTAIINAAIDSALTSYVDEKGERCGKNSWHARPYLDYIAEKTVEETVREVMKEVIEEDKENFKNEIKKQLSTKKFRESITAQYLQTIINATENPWKMPVSVNFENPR